MLYISSGGSLSGKTIGNSALLPARRNAALIALVRVVLPGGGVPGSAVGFVQVFAQHSAYILNTP